MEDIPNKNCLSDDIAYKHTSFDTIDRSLLPPGTMQVPVLRKPNTQSSVEYNCNKFQSNGLNHYYNEILNCSQNNRSRTCPDCHLEHRLQRLLATENCFQRLDRF